MTRTRAMHTRAELLAFAVELQEQYAADGFSLTLRQMYYQLVSRGWLENGQKHYKRVGDILTQARYNGSFPLDGLVDRGRSVALGDTTRCDTDVDECLKTAGSWIESLPEFLMQTDRWYGQDTYVSVWVEKEALAEIFERTCGQLGVGWFACKGYPSVSALYSYLKGCMYACSESEREGSYTFNEGAGWTERHSGTASNAVVLYFGDHDPDGWEIPRSCERNLAILQRQLGTDIPIEFKRIALNMDQIEEYDPPPFPAKMTSSRYASYVNEHGIDDAWELDALEPSVLQGLITEQVEEIFDESIYETQQGEMIMRQEELRDRMQDVDFYGDLF